MDHTWIDPGAPAIQRLEAALVGESAMQVVKARAILELALEAGWSPADRFDLNGRRAVRLGADGTALVDEALPLEVAALAGMSVTAAIWLIRDVVNLNSRHPAVWAAVLEGRVPLWRAQQLSGIAEGFDLDRDECLRVDARIAACVGVVGWPRVVNRFRASIIQVAPGKVAARAERARSGRHVHSGVSADDPAVGWMSALADAGDIQAVEHLLGLVTRTLIEHGDTDPAEVVRSKALGRLADPEGVLALLDGVENSLQEAPTNQKRSRRRHAPTAQVYIHLNPDMLTKGGPARVEGVGPVMVDQLAHLVGHHQIRLTPVVQVGGAEQPVDAYEIPEPMREQVWGRDRYEMFPWSAREARHCDLDHTIPYTGGMPGQTRPSNLGPLSRRAHRAKTHCGWQLEQPRPGVFLWTSPWGHRYQVGPGGTRRLPRDRPGDDANQQPP
ncbi:MAG: hypothetical protein QM633_02635 [Propionicimonas sp.]